MISTENLSFNYHGQSALSFPDMALLQGENLLVTGASGSGKTTLLHLIAGLLQPAAGTVSINGTFIHRLSAAKMDTFRGKNIGLIFQKHLFIGAINMKNNLFAAQTLPGFKTDADHIGRLMALLNIDHLAAKLPEQLSQGELQRFSVARALANRPLLLLADEPTSSLDDQNCEAFISLLLSSAELFNSTLIIATHDARLKPHFSTTYPI